MISPQDIKRNAFSKTLKGYSTTEVDEYILFLIKKYNEAYNEYAELERKYNSVLNQLNEVKSEENTISATIVSAQKMADAIVNDAKEKANEIKSAVSDGCDKILGAYMTKVTAERDKLAKCEEAVADFKESLYVAYKKHIALIDGIMPDEEPTPYLSDEELEDKAVAFANEKINPSTLEEINAAIAEEHETELSDGEEVNA